MFWTIFLVLLFVSATRPHPTSCAEDSHCSSGFFCEETHVCRECLHCEELLRAPPLPLPGDYCAKSVLECGPCRKGLVQMYEGVVNGLCSPPAAERPAPLLPLYGWAAIAASLLLMVVILCLFAKMKTIRIAYAAARTSVHSLQTEPRSEYRAPPPPYHNIDNQSPSSPHHEESEDDFELQKLVEPPQPLRAPLPDMRPRENSSSQAARVFHSPAYVRTPQNEASTTPKSPAQDQDEPMINNIVAVTPNCGDQVASARTNNNAITGVVESGTSSHGGSTRACSPFGKQITDLEVQDSNNNCSEAEASSSQQPRRSAPFCANVISGPSFVINVVENITNATKSHAEFHT